MNVLTFIDNVFGVNIGKDSLQEFPAIFTVCFIAVTRHGDCEKKHQNNGHQKQISIHGWLIVRR